MSILRPPSIPFYANPPLRPGLDALSWWLEDRHYTPHARDRILAYAAARGTPTGSPDLEAGDEAEATEAFVGGLPDVPPDDPAWDDQTFVLDAEMLAEGNHPWPIPTRPEDDDDRSMPPDAVLMPPELEREGFDPTPEDLEDLRRWEQEIEAGRPGLTIAPIGGGAPAPTAEDAAEARADGDARPNSRRSLPCW
jgi:hypothetical protein